MANSDDDGQRWAEQVVKTFGETAKRVRGKRSAKWLSDRTAELGYRVSPTVISKLDTGHRGSVLHLPEMLVIAQALDVSPVSLIFGSLPDGPFAMLPGREVKSIDALKWFTGKDVATDAEPADRVLALTYNLLDGEKRWGAEESARMVATEMRYGDTAERLARAKEAGADDREIAQLNAEAAMAAEEFARIRQIAESQRYARQVMRQALKDLGAEVHDG